LIANGMEASGARIIADVAVHAAEQAMETLSRVTEPLSGIQWVNAHGLALQLLETLAAAHSQTLQAKASELLPQGKIRTFTVAAGK
jgi:putative hemolysin